ncbi:hypothetical protein C8F04DRAFT_1299016 [Mycena alexandri]|uniref:Uncharacterized protein n=1 Tax=Mycena alexandri TaxID=1745969 RepID=A0AAD6SFC2_9AGAR|nr:hypothetical protein C8F04DRAFT_1299016 [Mycena alexandri]
MDDPPPLNAVDLNPQQRPRDTLPGLDARPPIATLEEEAKDADAAKHMHRERQLPLATPGADDGELTPSLELRCTFLVQALVFGSLPSLSHILLTLSLPLPTLATFFDLQRCSARLIWSRLKDEKRTPVYLECAPWMRSFSDHFSLRRVTDVVCRTGRIWDTVELRCASLVQTLVILRPFPALHPPLLHPRALSRALPLYVIPPLPLIARTQRHKGAVRVLWGQLQDGGSVGDGAGHGVRAWGALDATAPDSRVGIGNRLRRPGLLAHPHARVSLSPFKIVLFIIHAPTSRSGSVSSLAVGRARVCPLLLKLEFLRPFVLDALPPRHSRVASRPRAALQQHDGTANATQNQDTTTPLEVDTNGGERKNAPGGDKEQADAGGGSPS